MRSSNLPPGPGIPAAGGLMLALLAAGACATEGTVLDVAGVTVVPHAPTVATELRYTAPRGPTDGARRIARSMAPPHRSSG